MWSPLIQQTGSGQASSPKAAEQKKTIWVAFNYNTTSTAGSVVQLHNPIPQQSTPLKLCCCVQIHIIEPYDTQYYSLNPLYKWKHAVIVFMQSSSLNIQYLLQGVTIQFKWSKQHWEFCFGVCLFSFESFISCISECSMKIKAKTSGKKEIIWLVWANHFQTKMVKNVKRPATQQNEALNKICADLEVWSLATEMYWLHDAYWNKPLRNSFTPNMFGLECFETSPELNGQTLV